LGDPISADGDPAELVALALGKFGGREPNYHSDLDVIFLYSHAGETKRRVGGPRTTVTNHRFFNQLAQRVASRINGLGSQPALYELDGRLRPTGDEGTLAVSVEEFLKRFQHGVAPLWQRLALCKARCVSGSKRSRKATDKKIASVLAQTQWHRNMGGEIRDMRMRMQETAASENLKRAEGGSVDVEVIAQMLTLRHAADHPDVVRCNTIESLDALAAEGVLEESKSLSLANCYRTLRRIESRLRLLDTQERHELPSDDRTVKELAFLMNESDPTMITAQAEQARHTIRKLFNQIFDSVDC
jgi:glutamate-ammonia-ligase adenylyltransferase